MKSKQVFGCRECGQEFIKWYGRCPACGSWNSLDELAKPVARKSRSANAPASILHVETGLAERRSTNIAELDRVLGGGIVPGSLILLGGDPGIGKSTLVLQAAFHLTNSYGPVLYLSAEESAAQLKLRAERLGALNELLYVLCEPDLSACLEWLSEIKPCLLVVDSIQTVFWPEVDAPPGSIVQVRECTARLLGVAKSTAVPVILIGHVTKEGALAGPRLLEHIVDTVLYMEGERYQSFRVLRAIKNRFGSTNEIGIFQMESSGLTQVASPSHFFLSERVAGNPGSCVVSCLEGTRPLLVEIQALVGSTAYHNARRLATGVDLNRVLLMLAILDRRLGFNLGSLDVYVNAAGGLRIEEPAIDLGICVALISSFRGIPVNAGTVLVGEVGLAGEVRRVPQLEKRILEARQLGFGRCLVPRGEALAIDGIEVVEVPSVSAAIELALGG